MSTALTRALVVWNHQIIDPELDDQSAEADRCRGIILDMIQGGGLGWEGWVRYYPGDGAFKWCGAFAAHCWQDVTPKIRKKYFASTYRLSEYGRLNPGRKVRTSDIRPGDIVTVGDGAYGSHICLAMGWDKNYSELVTIEGNAEGRLPSGEWAEGVVMRVRPRDNIRAAYRPLKEDLNVG